MARIREIKKRMVAVKNIERITKTMQMIATAKFTSALQRAKATQPYALKIRQMVADVAAAAGDVEHPLLKTPVTPRKRELVLTIVSDRGLCGAYNSNVLRMASQFNRQAKAKGIEVVNEISGKKAVAFFRFAGLPVAERHTVFADRPRYEDVQRLAQKYIDAYVAGEFDAIRIVSTRFISNTRQQAQVMQLLPLATPAASASTESKKASAIYEFSPSAAELLAVLLPESVKTSLFLAFNDAIVSEQVMRMIAMKGATDNAKSLGKSLRRQYNRARQAKITTELMEVVAGAAALG